jgi:hypothetical protein
VVEDVRESDGEEGAQGVTRGAVLERQRETRSGGPSK